MFSSILSSTGDSLSITTAIICLLVALSMGLIISLTYMACDNYSKSFAVSLVVLPALVQVVISMVNGNLGTGVAVLGAFSLIRFRSVPGSSKDICAVFFAMAVGLATGIGYISFAFAVTVVMCLVILVLYKTNFATPQMKTRELKITIPEDLDYTGVFDDIFSKYTKYANLSSVKTTNLGSMFQLTYKMELKDASLEKKFIDELRCRNGNLTIICAVGTATSNEL
ncbi:MAG: DUF4956 domain-containing protein [Anaerotignaceae bacterium]